MKMLQALWLHDFLHPSMLVVACWTLGVGRDEIWLNWRGRAFSLLVWTERPSLLSSSSNTTLS
jgi:hypothetical protein